MKIYGDYNSDKARILQMQLQLCHDGGFFAENKIECKSGAEITEFLRNKFFIMLYNQKRFDTGSFGDESVKKEAKLLWLPINTQMRQTIPYKVSKSHLALQDKDINLNTITLE